MGQRLKQVAQEAQTQMISLSSSFLPGPQLQLFDDFRGDDDVKPATGHPFVHFLHCRAGIDVDSRQGFDLIDDSAGRQPSFLIFIGIGVTLPG